MAAAAAAHGVEFAYGRNVQRIERTGRRATAVITADGERFPADAVVINADLPAAYRDLLGGQPRRIRRLRYSPSCFVLLAGSRRRYSGIAQHNIHFGRSWSTVFSDLIDRRRVMGDPSLLVSNPTRSDSSIAPPGRQIYYILLPVPNLDADIDWAEFGPAYTDRVLSTLESRGYRGFADSLEVLHVRTPADWEALGLGTPFGPAHTFGQTGPMRPGNRWGENVVFAGSATRPGVGVPMALVSGRLAAERIVGHLR
jgi:phytoene desaturase